MTIDFCIPVFNEEKILEKNILKLFSHLKNEHHGFGWKITILDNGSNDNSLKICKNLADNKNIYFRNYNKAGKGYALKKYLNECNSDVLVYMDIDLAVSLNNITNLISPIINNKYDLVAGSRLLFESKTDRSFLREISSRIYNFLSQIILRHNFSDLQCGFKAIRTEDIKKITPFIKNENWFFDTELIILANKFNFKIKEIPVDWSENRYDKRKSKINILIDSFKFFINLISLKIRLFFLNS